MALTYGTPSSWTPNDLSEAEKNAPLKGLSIYGYTFQATGVQTIFGNWQQDAINQVTNTIAAQCPGAYIGYIEVDENSKTITAHFKTPQSSNSPNAPQAMTIPSYFTPRSQTIPGHPTALPGYAIPYQGWEEVLIATAPVWLPLVIELAIVIVAVIALWLIATTVQRIVEFIAKAGQQIGGAFGGVVQLLVFGALAIGGVYVAVKLIPAIGGAFKSKPRGRPREYDEDVDWL